MAIQGLTPDCANLASPWLLRIVTSGSVDGVAAAGGKASMPTPLHDSDAGDAASEICQTVVAKSAPRVRLEDDHRLCITFLAGGLRDRPIGSASRSHPSGCLVQRWPDGLIPSLCRFRC